MKTMIAFLKINNWVVWTQLFGTKFFPLKYWRFLCVTPMASKSVFVLQREEYKETQELYLICFVLWRVLIFMFAVTSKKFQNSYWPFWQPGMVSCLETFPPHFVSFRFFSVGILIRLFFHVTLLLLVVVHFFSPCNGYAYISWYFLLCFCFLSVP